MNFPLGQTHSTDFHGQEEVFDVSDLAQLDEVVRILRGRVRAPCVVYLYGDLGAGKTTLSQCWLRQQGVVGAIPSPTYNLVNEYACAGELYIHADLYRISDPEELVFLDARDWQHRADLVLIEWPDKGDGFIPPADVKIILRFEGDRRRLLWQTKSFVDMN